MLLGSASIELITIKLCSSDWARNATTPSGWVPGQVSRSHFFGLIVTTHLGPGQFSRCRLCDHHLGLIGIRTCGSYGNVNAIRLYQYLAIKLFRSDWARNAPKPSAWVLGQFSRCRLCDQHFGLIGISTCCSYGNVNAIRLYQYRANRY